ncbi:MAG: DedA family protein [Planctomycetes bacterium]|nr:DedA family protein [Planctomycetota bacterium]
MQEFIQSWGYLGVFLGILATGLGFPMPEELPIVVGGVLATNDEVRVWIMLPVCIVGVIIGDSFLYLIGRFWGANLLEMQFVRDYLLSQEKLESITENFKTYGIRILLFARLTPGIRAPIFLTAGITKLPLSQFILADGIYAIPGVSLLFFLGYWFTDSIIDLVNDTAMVKPIIVIVVLACIILYFAYHFWQQPVVEGSPTEMPPIVGEVTETLEEVADSVADKVMRLSHPDLKAKETEAVKKPEPASAKAPMPEDVSRNGEGAPKMEDAKASEPPQN